MALDVSKESNAFAFKLNYYKLLTKKYVPFVCLVVKCDTKTMHFATVCITGHATFSQYTIIISLYRFTDLSFYWKYISFSVRYELNLYL